MPIDITRIVVDGDAGGGGLSLGAPIGLAFAGDGGFGDARCGGLGALSGAQPPGPAYGLSPIKIRMS